MVQTEERLLEHRLLLVQEDSGSSTSVSDIADTRTNIDRVYTVLESAPPSRKSACEHVAAEKDFGRSDSEQSR